MTNKLTHVHHILLLQLHTSTTIDGCSLCSTRDVYVRQVNATTSQKFNVFRSQFLATDGAAVTSRDLK